jgi:hypothetical protein
MISVSDIDPSDIAPEDSDASDPNDSGAEVNGSDADSGFASGAVFIESAGNEPDLSAGMLSRSPAEPTVFFVAAPFPAASFVE